MALARWRTADQVAEVFTGARGRGGRQGEVSAAWRPLHARGAGAAVPDETNDLVVDADSPLLCSDSRRRRRNLARPGARGRQRARFPGGSVLEAGGMVRTVGVVRRERYGMVVQQPGDHDLLAAPSDGRRGAKYGINSPSSS